MGLEKYYQQGDVLIIPIDLNDNSSYLAECIREGTKKHVNELVVAYGEASGHSHVIRGKITQFIPKWQGNTVAFELTEEAYIYHEEHGEILLPAGTYYIETVREYDHFTEESRYVRD